MQFTFARHLILRRPVKNTADYFADRQSFLDDLFFQLALYLASPAFYNALERYNFQADELTDKESTTLQKYINRYCFRPTPFGLFSTVALLDGEARPGSVNTETKYRSHVSTSMIIQNLIHHHFWENIPTKKAAFIPNPSLYRILNEYRFFRTGLDETGSQRDYQLQSIAFSKILKDLITHCHKGCTRADIISQIIVSTSCTREEAEDYSDFLIDAQLLVNTHRISITGKDPLFNLFHLLKDGKARYALSGVFGSQADIAQHPSISQVRQLEQRLGALLQNTEIPDKLNIILQDEGSDAMPEMDYQGPLRDGLAALRLLSPSGQSSSMVNFVQAFEQHFEGQTIPLLQALDPEGGVGYQSPEKEKENPLMETLPIAYKGHRGKQSKWTDVHSVLMEAWLRATEADPQISLNDTDLDRLSNSEQKQQMLGMSVLFRIIDNKIFIENAGGVNAPALMGRFTVADEQIKAAAISMAEHLEKLNPDIIFAELLHLSDPHTDNINRRAHIYQYELPITAASSLPEARQIHLSDLYIKIVDKKAILFSESHQKIVIPRLTSAYNHSLNKLPLFRFLADLPYQFGIHSLSLDIRSIFPNLHYYARVVYKETILSLATWIVTEKQLFDLHHHEPQQKITAFDQLRKHIKLPRYFSLAEGDQELVFDGQRSSDVLFFCNCIRQKKELVLKEFLNQPDVQQYNTYLLPNEPFVLPKFRSRSGNTLQRKFIPGSNWLYLKIYVPKMASDRLLLRLDPLLRKRYGQYQIEEWFFIRYEDHAPHIRLRIKIDPKALSDVLIAFKARLEDRIQQHVIREYQIDIYTRELERYSAGGIRNSERFFWSSSELVIRFLKHTRATKASTHAFALYSTLAIIKVFMTDADEQIIFTSSGYAQFLPEFNDKPLKVSLDKKYRELNPEIMTTLAKTDPGLLSGSIRSGRKFLKNLQAIDPNAIEEPEKAAYLRSIIHMHLNRVFIDEARKQEMICYYLLHKYLLSLKGRNRKHKNTK